MASLSDPPIDGQVMVHDGLEYTTVKEGLAYILNPPKSRTRVDPQWKKKKDQTDSTLSQSVFYNPIQQFNRDLSVLAIRAYGEHVVACKTAEHEQRVEKKAGKEHRKRNRRKSEADNGLTEEKEDETVNGSKRRRIYADETAMSAGKGLAGQLSGEAIADEDDIPMCDGEAAVVMEKLGEQVAAAHVAAEAPSRVDVQVIPTETVEEKQHTTLEAVNGGLELHASEVDRAPADQQSTQPTTAIKAKALNDWKPKFRILDALSATGLRALRYAKEIPLVTSVTANDLSPSATASIQINVKHNNLEDRVNVTTSNALAHMYGVVCRQAANVTTEYVGKYDVIDLDPYGTAVPFLDAAVQALQDGGLLCVTCTDAGVFASTGYPERTYSLYGGLPSKGPQCHEVGLRLIVHAIASTAARYGLAIEPLLSLSIDFYARVFVRIRKSAAEVKFLAGKTMMVYNCDQGCGAWTTQFLARNQHQKGKKGGFAYKHSLAQAPTAASKCEHCGFKTHLSGPMWGGPLHNPAFIERVLRILDDLPDSERSAYATTDRIVGMLSMAIEETLSDSLPAAEVDLTKDPRRDDPSLIPAMDPADIDHHPFFFNPSALAKVLHCQAPSEAQIRGAIRHAGYRATRSHTKPGSIRTDAPWSAIWEIMREWVRQKAPVREGAIKPGTAGWRIMGLVKAVQGQTPQDKLPHGDKRDDSTAAESAGGDQDQGSHDVPISAEKPGAAEPADSWKESSNGETKAMKIVFDEKLGKDPDKKKLVRFQPNPRANWGPMTRAKGHG